MAVSKEVLYQYADLQREVIEIKKKIGELEAQIEIMEKEGHAADSVLGGAGGTQIFKVEGFPYPEYSRKKTLLYARKAILTELEMEVQEKLNEVETFIATVEDSHIRRIISLRFVEALSWRQVAKRMGKKYSSDVVRITFERFLKNN